MVKSNEEINIHLAECIRIKRENKKLSQRQLAKLSNVSLANISRLEGSNGYNRINSLLSVIKICDSLKIDINKLWKGFNK